MVRGLLGIGNMPMKTSRVNAHAWEIPQSIKQYIRNDGKRYEIVEFKDFGFDFEALSYSFEYVLKEVDGESQENNL